MPRLLAASTAPDNGPPLSSGTLPWVAMLGKAFRDKRHVLPFIIIIGVAQHIG